MSTADTKALIEQAVRNFQAEIPALAKLKLVIELELRGRGDIQLFRVEVPGPKVTRDIAWVVHVHAIVYIGWISLFLVQSTLIAKSRTDLHRQLGVFGAFWGALVVIVGIWTVFATMRPQIREGWNAAHGPVESLLWLAWSNAGNPIMFGLLFAPAIALRRRAQAHKRLMLLACLALMNAPLARALDDLGSPIVLGPFGFASPNSLLHGNLPCSSWATPSIFTAPGTPVARPLTTAVLNGSGLPAGSRNIVETACAGATSRPS